MVRAGGRLLHLSLSNLHPLAQQQLAHISSPLGLVFIKETIMCVPQCAARSPAAVIAHSFWILDSTKIIFQQWEKGLGLGLGLVRVEVPASVCSLKSDVQLKNIHV